MCTDLVAHGHEKLISDKTGLVIDALFFRHQAALDIGHVSGARARANSGELAFGTVDSWLIWELTAGRAHVTDASNASRTLLFKHSQRRLG
jgi:glycerol kinase